MKTMLSTVFTDDWFDGGYEVYDSLDEAIRLFRGLPGAKPKLKEALVDIFVDIKLPIEKIESLLNDCKEFANIAREDPEIAKCGLTDDEAGAIFCYTYDLRGVKSMYKIINESLEVHWNSKSLLATRKFIYLLLSGLRKLPLFPLLRRKYTEASGPVSQRQRKRQ